MRMTHATRRDQKIQGILIEHESDSLDDLVREYARMGYSEYATARRLLGIDVKTMRGYLSGPVHFKPYASNWQDYDDTARKVVAARMHNGSLRMIESNGVTMHLAEWSRVTGVPTTTILKRLDRSGLPASEALSSASRRKGANNPHRPKPTPLQGIDFSNPTNGSPRPLR
jgi:hypothetical protein